MRRANANLASIGLKTKTGRAIVVVLRGPADSPLILKRAEIALVNPKVPGTSQPHHEVMDLPWHEALSAVRPLVKQIEDVSARALGLLLREVESGGCKVCGVGIAGAADRRLEKIGNSHIRAHAAEGLLFRQVLESAADANRLAKRVFVEKELEQLAVAELGLTSARLQGQLATFGHSAGPPWRADQRIAAIAGWLILASS